MTRYYFSKDVEEDYVTSLKKARLICVKAMLKNPRIDYIEIYTTRDRVYMVDDSIETVSRWKGFFVISQTKGLRRKNTVRYSIKTDGSKGRKL